MNKSILVISDTHIPYHHKDLIPFLAAIKKFYKPDRVVHIGDELDKHALSFHDSDPDLPSAGDELKISLPYIKARAVMGTAAGQWSARKAQLLAKTYKARGGGYK